MLTTKTCCAIQKSSCQFPVLDSSHSDNRLKSNASIKQHSGLRPKEIFIQNSQKWHFSSFLRKNYEKQAGNSPRRRRLLGSKNSFELLSINSLSFFDKKMDDIFSRNNFVCLVKTFGVPCFSSGLYGKRYQKQFRKT